ncbi:response regulator [Aurantiacibacter spongiae]|uniref:Response regulator n=1 Tax=Aurantiacibacter spongiae TaxID=2488860 RepID=A0A3N5DHH2_9SPHN|nr:response regulator [Aurantiacibacter spongiae]RPF71112.1 response regulator [Aurantiacibacter spongiae]
MSKKIMIVEDDGMIAMLLEDILDALGYEIVGPAGSIPSALEILDDCQPDAAIVDLRLGEHDSYPVMDRLRELDIPFAVASGYGADIDRSRSGSETVIIPKPYVLEDVERALGEMLG